MPPRWLNPIGDGSFESTGDEFLGYFKELCGLQPTADVLDVGCGIGRMARPLTKYLTTGSYEGFDITPAGIKWCRENITARYPNFRFTLADIQNKEYNAAGRVPAADYRFPYDDCRFDFAFLTSVFTHMLPDEVARYISELSRVLVPGGTCLATFFFVNPEAQRLISAGDSSLDLSHPLPGCWTANPTVPETAIGYAESAVQQVLRQHGFSSKSPLYGLWCGREQYYSYQDILVFRKDR